MVSMMVIGPGIVTFSFFFVCARASFASVACTRPFSFNSPTTCGTIAL